MFYRSLVLFAFAAVLTSVCFNQQYRFGLRLQLAPSAQAFGPVDVAEAPGSEPDNLKVYRISRKNLQRLYKRPAGIPFPKSNRFTPERVQLGKKLFFDPRLSGGNQISCATCHNPSLQFTDLLPVAVGEKKKAGSRRVPSLWNVAWAESMFHDGRVRTLEEQALIPIKTKTEMNQDPDKLVDELKAIPAYRRDFAKAYPRQGITKETIAKSLANFQRTIVSGETPFDRYVAGDRKAISPLARKGLVLFHTKARCVQCHSGWQFSDQQFHDIGVHTDDIGRAKVEPNNPRAKYAFKTPPLRNVALRAPYFHNGLFPSLKAVLAFYNAGGAAERPGKSRLMQPLNLNALELQALEAFLHTLSDNKHPGPVPALPGFAN